MKFLSLALKLLPLCTLIYGLVSGGSRMGPFVDTVQVALTQYELSEISLLVHAHLKDKGKPPEKAFGTFVRERFHSQYSVLAREIKGEKSHDHGKDIWGHPYKLNYDREGQVVKIFSAGPDGLFGNLDDIVASVGYDDGSRRRTAEKPVKEVERSPASQDDVQTEDPPIDEYGNPYANEKASQDEEPVALAEEPVENREPAAEETYPDQDQPQEEVPAEETTEQHY
jgi:hypothetical protein